MPQPYKLLEPYVRTHKRTGEKFHLFTIQLRAALWPKVDRQSKAANRKPTTYLSELLQEAILRKEKK